MHLAKNCGSIDTFNKPKHESAHLKAECKCEGNILGMTQFGVEK